jgi:uncharacterized cupin superfamily protein
MNLLDDEGWLERTHPPPQEGFEWNRKRVSGERLGASLYELPPGEKTFPYHYELGNDELLVVVAGTPTLRDPEGEHQLRPGDCILFPSGPAGAHQIVNTSDEPARVLLVSNLQLPRAAVQPDSDKVMIRWGPGWDESLWFRRAAAADYWEGEAD